MSAERRSEKPDNTDLHQKTCRVGYVDTQSLVVNPFVRHCVLSEERFERPALASGYVAAVNRCLVRTDKLKDQLADD